MRAAWWILVGWILVAWSGVARGQVVPAGDEMVLLPAELAGSFPIGGAVAPDGGSAIASATHDTLPRSVELRRFAADGTMLGDALEIAELGSEASAPGPGCRRTAR